MRIEAIRYRIRPTKEQAELLEKHINANRFVHNCCISLFEVLSEQYRNEGKSYVPNYFELIHWIRDMRNGFHESGETWLGEVNQKSLAYGCMNAHTAYKKFLEGKCKFPKFKKKSTHGKFKMWDKCRIKKGKLWVFRQNIRAVIHKQIPKDARIIFVTIEKNGDVWHASFNYETDTPVKNLPRPTTEWVGVDLGLKTLVVTSNGNNFVNGRNLSRRLKVLKRHGRHLSRCQKGSNRYKRTRKKLNATHQKIANSRRYQSQQIAYSLVHECQNIVMEDLQVKNLIKNKCLSRGIHDAGWGAIKQQIKRSCKKYERNLILIDKFFPSSKLCNKCGSVNKALSLRDRSWQCSSCHQINDRDLNAALNIRDEGKRIFSLTAETGCGRIRLNDVEDATPESSNGIRASDEPSKVDLKTQHATLSVERDLGNTQLPASLSPN